MFKRKKDKIKEIEKKINLNIIFTIILVLSSLILAGLVIYANIFPIKYLAPSLFILIIIALLIVFKLLSKKTKSKTRKIFHILSILLSVFF